MGRETEFRSLEARLELGVLLRLRKALLGYDFFISYRHGDGLGYALALENELSRRNFVCFRDARESGETPRPVRRMKTRREVFGHARGSQDSLDHFSLGRWVAGAKG